MCFSAHSVQFLLRHGTNLNIFKIIWSKSQIIEPNIEAPILMVLEWSLRKFIPVLMTSYTLSS